VISITSPCVLPLLPGYVAFISSWGGPAEAAKTRSQRVGAALLFSLGFSVIFAAMGATASIVGQAVAAHRAALTRVSGLFLVAVGLVLIGAARLPRRLAVDRRMPLHAIRPGPRSACFLGAAFALGWAPCIGPVLAAVLTAAAVESPVLRGSVLLGLYSVGLALPFIGVALFMDRSASVARVIADHRQALERAAGLVLVTIGVAYLSGGWDAMFRPLQRWMSRTGWPPLWTRTGR
jgi:cytochrome c-type biogenesis protein